MNIPAQSDSNTGNGESKIHPFAFFSFQGNGGTLFGIQIVNLLLIIITLGIYYFWAKTRVRSYIWSQADFDTNRFAYSGTGMEVLMGWLKALLVFGVPFYAFQNVPALTGAPTIFIIAGALLSFLLIAIFIPVAIVGSRRYRLSRTSLLGIRFSFRGKWREFLKIIFACSPWMILTLGLYMPYFDMRRQSFLIENSYFGNERFGFDGKGKDLLGSYILALLLALPTFLLSFVWYSCKKTRYTWNHTSFGEAHFQSKITFGGIIGLYLVNGLILIFTLGFGAPWVKVRTLCYYLENLSLERKFDLSAIIQQAQESTAFGEEVGDFLDMDFDLG